MARIALALAIALIALAGVMASNGSTQVGPIQVGAAPAQASHNCFWSYSTYTDHIHTNCTSWVAYWEANGWVCFYYDSWGGGHGDFYLRRR